MYSISTPYALSPTVRINKQPTRKHTEADPCNGPAKQIQSLNTKQNAPPTSRLLSKVASATARRYNQSRTYKSAQLPTLSAQ
jgi:hypothetical protein